MCNIVCTYHNIRMRSGILIVYIMHSVHRVKKDRANKTKQTTRRRRQQQQRKTTHKSE